MKTIELHLKAVDFKDTYFGACRHCAISKAVKRQLGRDDVYEDIESIIIDACLYAHKPYEFDTFVTDKALATSAGFDSTTIRTIILTKA